VKPRIVIVGAGKVGTSLCRALEARGAEVELRSARRPPPRRPIDADLLILAVRDAQLGPLALSLSLGLVTRRTPVVHCSGGLGPEALSVLRRSSAGVAQMHPMISFASRGFVPPLAGGQVGVDGDPRAVAAARRVARLLGMSPRSTRGLDRTLYHAAAGVCANGAAALCSAAIELLCAAGAKERSAARMLGPLLRSVAGNVEKLGMPRALTGPVERGDARVIARQQAVIARRARALVPLYRALIAAQVELSRKIGGANGRDLDQILAIVGAPRIAGPSRRR
jgi:predicted short-subunit dehydrogenase-like oxidoreductase (DUF2520 family)